VPGYKEASFSSRHLKAHHILGKRVQSLKRGQKGKKPALEAMKEEKTEGRAKIFQFTPVLCGDAVGSRRRGSGIITSGRRLKGRYASETVMLTGKKEVEQDKSAARKESLRNKKTGPARQSHRELR